MNRLLFLLHRWLGVCLSLFMLLWFFSGLVMVYMGQASVSLEQRLARAAPLHPEENWLTLGEAWRRTVSTTAHDPGIAEARLVRQGGTPIWLVQDNHGQRHALSALDGIERPVSPTQALAIARAWAGGAKGSVAPSLLETTNRDAATTMMSYDPFRPFHHLALNDDAGTELYVSARTGEVVRASSRFDRLLFWCGSYLHFLRPLDAIGLASLRKDVLTWGALAGVFAVITGLWIGVKRWRPGWFGTRRYADGRSNPYRAAWPKWHLWLGLTGGALALTWIFSGFLANNPWQLFSGHSGHQQHELGRYRGGSLLQRAQLLPMADIRAAIASKDRKDIIELAWHHLGGEAILFGYERNGSGHELLRLDATEADATGKSGFDEATLLAAAGRLQPGNHPLSYSWQQDYDHYYYRQHHHPASERPLPVLRVELGDAAGTWLYLNPATGEQVARLDHRRRVYRWLFNGLHSWDIGWLDHRPVWDIWMVLGSVIGLALSLTSVVIGWRRLRRKFLSHRLTGSPELLRQRRQA